MTTCRNDLTTYRWALFVLALLAAGLSPAAVADPTTALAERGAHITRDPSGDGVMVRFERPLARGDVAELAKIPQLTSLLLHGPERDADLNELKTLTSLKSLQVFRGESPDAGLRAIAGLANLQSLNLLNVGVTDGGLAELKPLTKLRDLVIFNSRQVTDEGLAHLKAQPHLRTLWLGDSRITGTGLGYLHELKELERLSIQSATITDDGLQRLVGMPQLRDLRLVGCRLVGDEGLRHLAGLSKLRRLELSSTAITSAGLKHLSGLSSLEFLSLGHTKVADSGLAHLAALDNLEMLVVHETNLTEQGVERLKEQLPKLTQIIGAQTLARKAAAATPPAKDLLRPSSASPGKRRWAIIATDQKLAGLADLLTAELSTKPSVELVERQQIKTVVAELQLQASGLVAPQQAARLGGLLKADALLLLEGIEQPGSPTIRLRLVEVGTAIKLVDVLLPLASIDRQLKDVVAELDQAEAKLATPEDQRRYLGILAIKSEEPGQSLASTCRTLTALVEARLHKQPRFIVLEREQLRRLTDESNLTGAELGFHGSTWLLEAGVRRADRGGLAVTVRLVVLAKRAEQTLRVAVASGDPVEIRNQLVAEIERAVGFEGARTADADLVDEASFFARRRDWLYSAHQYQAAADLAEAALILAPLPDNLRQALSAYSTIAHAADSQLKSHEALSATHRYQELSLEWMRNTAPDNPMRKGLSHTPFQPHIRIPLDGESEEDCRLRAEMVRLSQDRFNLLLAEAQSRPDRRLDLLLHKLDHVAYIAQTGREFASELPPLIDQIERALQQQDPKTLTSERSGKFCELLLKAVGSSILNCDRGGGRSPDRREWKREEVAGLWDQLATRENLIVRMAGNMALASQPGKRAEQAAGEIMDRIKDLPPPTPFWLGGYDGLASLALARLPMPRSESFLDGLIKATEQSRDPAPLLRYRQTVQGIVNRADLKQNQEWSRRILSALDKCDSLAAKDRDQRTDRLQVTGAQLQAIHVAELRRNLIQALTDRGSPASRAGLAPSHAGLAASRSGAAPPPDFSLAEGEGPWADYIARPIAIAKSQENGTLHSLWVDRNEDAKDRGEELVLVWSRKTRHLSVERVALGGGTPRKFGPDFAGFPRPFGGIQIAAGDAAMFVASDAAGFVCLRAERVETIDESQGAPASQVLQLAWWKDRLFVAYRDAFASYDPRTKKFETLASALTVEPRNPLDGRGSFFVIAVIPDEESDCLWLHVQDNAPPRVRNGLWRYEPESKEFSQITSDRVSWSWTEDGIFLNLSQETPRWALLERRNAQLKILSGYRPWSRPLDARFTWPRVIKIGDHIITEAGQLYTPDGKIHQFKVGSPWDHFQGIGPGFLTYYESQTGHERQSTHATQNGRLWYVEPKGAKPAVADAMR